MSSIGPRELYVSEKQAACFAKITENNSIVWFNSLIDVDSVREALNGNPMRRNALMLAAEASYPSLVKHIVTNITDKRVLMFMDNTGLSTLYHAIHGTGAKEKVKECVQILIDAGADPDMKSGIIWPPAKLLPNLNEQPKEGKLSNLIGLFVSRLGVAQNNKLSGNQNEVDYWSDRLALFISIAPLATCYITEIGEIDTEPCAPSDSSQTEDAREMLCNYKKILITARTTAIWQKMNMRLLFLASFDKNSSFSMIPYEVVRLISQHFAR